MCLVPSLTLRMLLKRALRCYRNYNVMCDGEEKLFHIFSCSFSLQNTSEPSMDYCLKYCAFIILSQSNQHCKDRDRAMVNLSKMRSCEMCAGHMSSLVSPSACNCSQRYHSQYFVRIKENKVNTRMGIGHISTCYFGQTLENLNKYKLSYNLQTLSKSKEHCGIRR